MSVGSNLQEMENVVTKGAKPAESMSKGNASGVTTPGQTAGWEDLGGPTPQNYRPDDDSAKLKDPSATLAAVKNVVNAKAAKAQAGSSSATSVKTPGQGVKEETVGEEEDLISEEETVDDSAESLEEVGDESSAEDVEEQNETEDEFDIEEDVNALLAGEELSEEFQEKARIIFESAIKSKVSDIKEDLQEKYENALISEIEIIKESLSERLDAYLEYVADEWISENALAVEHGLKTEMTESFLTGMKQLFEEHYVTIPEDRYDVIESMVDKLDEMEEKLNEQIEKNVALNQRLAESVADVIFSEISEGLALSQKDKLASLAENVEFDSEENYREKLVTLRESYFPTRTASTQRDVPENLSESTDLMESAEAVSPRMESYLKTLGRVSKK
jgi:hypothetical protein